MVAQESQRIAGRRVRFGLIVEQILAEKRRQWRFTTHRGDLQPDLAIASSLQMIGPQRPLSDLYAEAISGRTVEAITRPGDGRALNHRFRGDFGGKHTPRLIIPQNADAG